MRARLIAAPFDDTAPPLGQVLKDALGEEGFERLDIVVAWVKRSGLRLVAPDLARFRGRGGEVRAIVGIDERGATHQGLELIRANADDVVVYREPAGGTFHPKIYVFRGERKAMIIAGSSNMTRGGLFDNYEASLCIELDLPKDGALLASTDKYLDLLRAQEEVALALDDALMARLRDSPLIQDEDRHRESASADSESRAPVLPFGRVTARKLRSPAVGVRRSASRAHRARPGALARQPGRTVAESDAADLSRRWLKKLSASDAQRTPSGTNITGELRLTQAGFRIDQTTYFRRRLLKSARWRPTRVSGRPAEEANIDFDIRVENRYLGRHRLRVIHVPHREFGQGNYTTAIKWGALSEEMRRVDYTGQWVAIDIDNDGRFGLSIQRVRPTLAGDVDSAVS